MSRMNGKIVEIKEWRIDMKKRKLNEWNEINEKIVQMKERRN